MEYEVELKYRVADHGAIIDTLEDRGARCTAPQLHCDTYFNHPERNFAETDEAFRIRSIGNDNRLTYKGPLIDSQTKTRQEVEVGCEPGETGRQKLHSILTALDFREVLTVEKHRIPWHLEQSGRRIEITLDTIVGLGRFVELETIAGEEEWQSARDQLLALAASLGLEDSERRSYLQLLLEGQSGGE